MTCREFAEFIMDYLTGELPADTLAAFEGHLRGCRNCRRYLAGYEETVKLGQRAFDDDDAPVPGAVPEDLVRGILAAQRSAWRSQGQ